MLLSNNSWKKYLFIILILLIVIFLLVSKFNNNSNKYPIMEVDDYVIYNEEFELIMNRSEIIVAEKFIKEHNLDSFSDIFRNENKDIENKFYKKLSKHTIEEVKRIYLIKQNANIFGHYIPIEFSEFVNDFEATNKERQRKYANGEIIYGRVQYDIQEYYFLILNNAESFLKRYFYEESNITENYLKSFYKESFKTQINSSICEISIYSAEYINKILLENIKKDKTITEDFITNELIDINKYETINKVFYSGDRLFDSLVYDNIKLLKENEYSEIFHFNNIYYLCHIEKIDKIYFDNYEKDKWIVENHVKEKLYLERMTEDMKGLLVNIYENNLERLFSNN